MKIRSLKIRDYRTLESLDREFTASYAAICGANDSGKTNIIRAIRAIMNEERWPPSGVYDDQELSLKDEYPKWKSVELTNREILLELSIALQRERDAGFYLFVEKQLSLADGADTLDLTISLIPSRS